MIEIMSFKLNQDEVTLSFDGVDTWFVIHREHPTYCKSFIEASRKMDEAIQEIKDSVPARASNKTHPNPAEPEAVPSGKRMEPAIGNLQD